jgi:autotransporter-associated beta strand protein
MSLLPGSLGAQFTDSRTWLGNSGNATQRTQWTRNQNWNGGNQPNTANIEAFFTNNSAATTVDLNNNNRTVGRLTFTATSPQYNFISGSRNLNIGWIDDTTGIDGGAVGIANNANQTHTFSNNFTLATTQTWRSSHASGGGLTISGTINLGAHTLYFDPANSGNTITVNGVMSGSGGLTMSGAGLLLLGGAHTYTGATTLNAGTTRLTASNRIADGSALVINAGATFDLNNFSDTVASLAGTGGTLALGSGTLTSGGSNASTAFAGAITGTGALVKNGSGTLTLSGNSSYSGGTTLNAGALAVGSNTALGTGTLTFADGTTLQASGGARTLTSALAIGGFSPVGITFGGSNDLTLTGNFALGGNTRTLTVSNTGITTLGGVVSNGYYTDTTINGGGTLVLSGNNTWQGTHTITGNTTLQLEHANALGPSNFSNVVTAGSTLSLSHGTGMTITEGAFNISGTGVGGLGALRNLAGSNTLASTLNLDGNTTVAVEAGSLTLNGTLAGGAFDLTLAGAGDFIASGTVNNLATANLTGGGDVTFSGVANITNLNLNGTGTATLSGSASNNIANATINSGTLVLAKNAGTNALSGTITVGDGSGTDTLRWDASNQIANSSSLIVNSSGTANLNGFDETLSSIAMTGGLVTTGAGTLTLNSSAAVATSAHAAAAVIEGNLGFTQYSHTFDVADGAAAQDLVVSANISGSGGNRLIKTGAGTLVLSGTNKIGRAHV